MVLVFIICILIFLVLLITFSTIRIQVENFEASNIENMKKPKNYKIKIALYLFNKIKWIWISLDDKKIQKISQKSKWNEVDIKKYVDVKDIKLVKKLSPKISFLNLKVKLGTFDILTTTYLVAILSTFIAVLLPYTIKKYKKENYYYEILPVYSDKNLYEIKLNCIIEEKMVHIISIVYALLKKRRVDKNERTSNRRSYAYSHE
mgnify:FL=1